MAPREHIFPNILKTYLTQDFRSAKRLKFGSFVLLNFGFVSKGRVVIDLLKLFYFFVTKIHNYFLTKIINLLMNKGPYVYLIYLFILTWTCKALFHGNALREMMYESDSVLKQ